MSLSDSPSTEALLHPGLNTTFVAWLLLFGLPALLLFLIFTKEPAQLVQPNQSQPPAVSQNTP